MSDETAKSIFLFSGIMFGTLCGAVATKYLLKALTSGKLKGV